MAITRVRTGCLTCRRRKKKCDEKKDTCGGCRRNNFTCHWPQTAHLESRKERRTSRTSRTNAEINLEDPPDAPNTLLQVTAHSPPLLQVESESIPDNGPLPTTPTQQPPTPRPTTQSDHDDESLFESFEEAISGYDEICHDLDLVVPQSGGEVVPPSRCHGPVAGSLSLLPQLDHDSTSLLAHYLERTANSMGNGSTEANPFIVKLIPLAFSSELLLHLLLTQSAGHRAVSQQEIFGATAQAYYVKSMKLFRESLRDYLGGKQESGLILTLGTLIMFLTEVARGDVNGAVFQHLRAAKSFLDQDVSLWSTKIPPDLQDFLVEYYTYSSTVSLISVDPTSGVNLVLNLGMWERTHELVAKRYVGNLCGCWLELLLMIPTIFDLGKGIFERGNETTPSTDEAVMFAQLQLQIASFNPDPLLPEYVALASRIYQQAMLLYLWTILKTEDEGTMHGILIQDAVSQAFGYLEQLPPTCRINTSLCWPLAVIGSCISAQTQQDALRTRLQTMFNVIGLGNMKETLLLLEELWKRPVTERGPWTLWKGMQNHEKRISFA